MDDPLPVAGAAPASVPERRRGALLTTLWTLCALVVALDQTTKVLALRYLGEQESVPVLGELLHLRLVFNPGAAFSLGTGMTWLLTAVAVIVVVAVVRISRRLGSRGWAVALGLLLGGALGNLIDRVARDPGFPNGHVVDFLAYGSWFVGNVADIAIVVAAGLVVLLGLRGVGVDGRHEP